MEDQTMKTVLLQFLLFIAIILGSVSVAAAQWTTIGSAGTVDEADLAEFETAGPQVRIRSTATVPATVVVRYNVVNVDGMQTGAMGMAMNARYRDNGSGARVLTRLRQVNINTGATRTIMSVDSDDFPPATTFQTQTAMACTEGFNFSTSAYYIETTLTQSATGGTPALEMIQLIAPADC
jgi:hypothetical protein